MRAGSRRVLQVIGVVALGSVGLWLYLHAALRGLWDPGITVYSHNGHWVLKPSLVLPSSPGQPPAFVSRGPPPLIDIPEGLATPGREMLVTGPGCGLLKGTLGDERRITLPPPIEVKIRVPGDFALPSGDHGITLDFHASGVAPEVETVVEGAAAPADHWERPESPFWDEEIWLDPVTRSVSVLLPCTGVWRVTWTHTTRPEPGKTQTFALVFGTGESLVNVTSSGEEHALEIDPDALDSPGVGLGGD